MTYEVTVDGKPHRLELERAENLWKCRLDGREMLVDAILVRPDVLSLLIEGRSYELKREQTATDLHLWVGNTRFGVQVRDPRSLCSRRDGAGDANGPMRLVCPMPGKIVRVLVTEKSAVEAGQGIVVVEAMKMQNEIKSPKKGVVQKILASDGASVNAGDVLAIVE
jgi:biotin carboxyl carrier protein